MSSLAGVMMWKVCRADISDGLGIYSDDPSLLDLLRVRLFRPHGLLLELGHDSSASRRTFVPIIMSAIRYEAVASSLEEILPKMPGGQSSRVMAEYL